MYTDSRILYFCLSKTGCTYTQEVLAKALQGELSERKHVTKNQLTPAQAEGFDRKLKVGTIRNPWDWYVSLWGWGCARKGALHRSLSGVEGWEARKHWYDDVRNPGHFRQWLRYIIRRSHGRTPRGSNTPAITASAGMLTRRYLKMYTDGSEHDGTALATADDIQAFDARHNFIDRFLRTETLDADLDRLIAEFGGVREARSADDASRNRSERIAYPYYYDDETAALVLENERLIVEKHGYTF